MTTAPRPCPSAWTVRLLLLGLVLAACTSGGGEDDAPDAAADAAGAGFYCGEFGAEGAPTLLAIDLATGAPAWRLCSTSVIPVTVAGRAVGATILFEQDGQGSGAHVGVDDTGTERWRRPARADGTSLFVSGPMAITVAAEVEAIEAATGHVRWRHPVADGTPLGTAAGLVIEASGGPYALSTDVAGGDRRPPTLRAIDGVTGEQRWTRSVELAGSPPRTQYAPTIGGTEIVLASMTGGTTVMDAATGSELRSERGYVVAEGGLLVERDPNTSEALTLTDPASGAALAPPDGTLVRLDAVGTAPPAAAGLLVASEPPTGPAARLRMVDVPSGEVRWEVPYRVPVGRSGDHVFVVDGPRLEVLDADDGSVLTEYVAPTDLATFTSAHDGDGIVVVSAAWRGSPHLPPTGPVDAPDCTGGPVILDTVVDDRPLLVRESSDGTVLCSDALGPFGRLPTVPSPDPRFDSVGQLDEGAWYTFVLPDGFPESITVQDERGEPMPVGRGVAADYLLVMQPRVGQSDGQPVHIRRTLRLLGADGAVLAEVSFDGFAEEDLERVTFEDFTACAADHGVEVPGPPPEGGAPEPAPASRPEALRAAWDACADLLTGYLRSSQQGGPEVLADMAAVHDCLAAAGYYPAFGQPVADQAAMAAADGACRASSPGRLALDDCLIRAGAGTDGDGGASAGPHPPALASAAWSSCRDLYTTWFVAHDAFAESMLGPLDCEAALGWITAVLDPDEHVREDVIAARRACRTGAG